MIKHNYTQYQLKAIQVCATIALQYNDLTTLNEMNIRATQATETPLKQRKEYTNITAGIQELVCIKGELSDKFRANIDFEGCLKCLDGIVDNFEK